MRATEQKEQPARLGRFRTDGYRFSRAFTKSENMRMRMLTFSYEDAGTFPLGEISCIENYSEISQNRVCFLPKNGTFYLPTHDLTDEQLLQIIHFHHKREYYLNRGRRKHEPVYSRSFTGAKTRKKIHGVSLFRRDALTLGIKWVNTIYGRNVADWEATLQMKDSPNYGYNIYAISYKDKKSKAATEYSVILHAGTGSLLEIQCPYNGKRKNMSKGLSARSKKSIRKKYKEVNTILEQAGYSNQISSCYCKYLSDQKTHTLAYGTISFLIAYSDGTGLEIYYSYNSNEIYQIKYIDDMENDLKKETIYHGKYSAKHFIRTRLE